MTTLHEIALLRLVALRIACPGSATATEAVRWLTALQAQDYNGALTSQRGYHMLWHLAQAEPCASVRYATASSWSCSSTSGSRTRGARSVRKRSASWPGATSAATAPRP